MIIFCY